MIYKFVMCEGSCEKAFLDILVDRQLLYFNRRDLLNDRFYFERQISQSSLAEFRALNPGDQVQILRVGDKLSDHLRLPKDALLKKKIVCPVLEYAVRPEFEIILIINEGLYKEFLKFKSKEKPSIFYKRFHRDYSKQSSYISNYFASMKDNEIVRLLFECQRLRRDANEKGQNSFYDLLGQKVKKCLANN